MRRTKREGCHTAQGVKKRKMKLTVSNTPERASQDKDCRSLEPLERACSVKWG